MAESLDEEGGPDVPDELDEGDRMVIKTNDRIMKRVKAVLGEAKDAIAKVQVRGRPDRPDRLDPRYVMARSLAIMEHSIGAFMDRAESEMSQALEQAQAIIMQADKARKASPRNR